VGYQVDFGLEPIMDFSERIYTLEDLKKWTQPGKSLAVIGHPIEHSLSPVMHNAALADIALYNTAIKDWHYYKFDIVPADLKEAIELMYTHGFRGINLTIPHKTLVMDLVTQIDPLAKRIGAANTLTWAPGSFMAFNTDAPGIEKAIEQAFLVSFRGNNVILLGAGGAARAAAVQAIQSGCESLWIGNRDQQRLQKLLDDLKQFTQRDNIHGFPINQLPEALPKEGIVINATSVGMSPGDPAPIGLNTFSNNIYVYDMIYSPPLTPLLRQAQVLEVPYANGLTMLVQQGALALELWTGAIAPVRTMMAAIERCLL